MPGQTFHVGDLVEVGDDTGDAARDHRLRVAGDVQQRALRVDVTVDETGRDILAVQIERVPGPIVVPDAGDPVSAEGDVPASRSRR